ncbi:MAG TPA: hypothetical protein VGM23_18565, partial [Armatimonadota bacterium]
MFRMHLRGKMLVLLLAGCLMAAASLAQAANPPKEAKPAEAPAPMAVGTFDMDAVFPQYDGFKKANERFKTFYEDRGSVLNEMQLGFGLNEKDFDEFAGLTGDIVAKKVNADRINELKAL